MQNNKPVPFVKVVYGSLGNSKQLGRFGLMFGPEALQNELLKRKKKV